MIDLDQGGRVSGHTRRVPPPAGLEPWVEWGWADRGGADGWRIVPDAAPHLILSESERGGELRRRLAVVGPRSRHLDIDRSSRVRTVGVRLRPGSLGAVFGVSARELRDISVVVRELVDSRLLDRGPDRPGEALPGDAAVMEGLWTLLGKLLDRRGGGPGPRGPDWRVRGVLARARGAGPGGRPTLRAIGRKMGVSPRTLRQTFRDEVGLPPSVSLRIGRLQGALLRGLRSGGAWSAVAVAAGYADQSHLIRDCRDLLGETPGEFLRRGRGRSGGAGR